MGFVGGAQYDAYVEATAAIIKCYKEANALDLQGGTFNDTALCKACAVGNVNIAIELLKAGAGLSPLA